MVDFEWVAVLKTLKRNTETVLEMVTTRCEVLDKLAKNWSSKDKDEV